MKHFKTYEGFKKDYMTKIDLKDFKSIKKGTKVLYMGAKAEVLDNNGFILTLKQNGKKFTVNKSMFDHGGMISEGVMSNIHLMADASKDWDDFLKKFKKDYRKIFQNTPDFMDWLYGIYKDMAPEKVEEGFTKLADLDNAIRHHEDGNPYYDRTKLINIYNGLKSSDQEKAKKKYSEVFGESKVNEAYVPSNIASFAKDRGVLADVKQIARWAEKAGKRIVGGTAIGKGYDTLILDLTYQGAEIYFDTYEGTIEVNRQPVTDWKSFSKAVNESVNEGEITKKTFLDLWKETYGENFIKEYPAVAKIMKNRPDNIDKREIARIWDETYGEDFKEEYPGIWDKLD